MRGPHPRHTPLLIGACCPQSHDGPGATDTGQTADQRCRQERVHVQDTHSAKDAAAIAPSVRRDRVVAAIGAGSHLVRGAEQAVLQ